jgi:transposase
VLRLLRYRHKLVQLGTRAKNSLQALAFSAGSAGRSKLLSREGRTRFLQLPMSGAMARPREQWLSLVDELNARIKSLDAWLEQQAKRDKRVLRLETHPGIGLLTSLALVHSLEPVTRFGGSRKVAAYAGLEPMEYSSGDQQRFGSISKSGSRLLRYLLVEAGQITIRRDEELKRFYLRLRSSTEVSKHGWPGLPDRLLMSEVCDWAACLSWRRVRSDPHGPVSAQIDD